LVHTAGMAGPPEELRRLLVWPEEVVTRAQALRF
jgi:hypothetical protein